MHYQVETVGDNDLPEGVHLVIVERDDAPPILILNGQPARLWAMMRAWEDTCECPSVPTVLRLAV